MNELDNVDDPCDAPLILRNLKLKNINRLVLAHELKYKFFIC